MSHPHNSHFGVTSSEPHFAINHIAACCAVTLRCMPDIVVLPRDFFWVPFYLFVLFCCCCCFFSFGDWIIDVISTRYAHLASEEPSLSSLPPHLCCFCFSIIWLNSKTFLCACQSLDESRLHTYVIWVAVKHEPAINYTAIWAMHLERIDCLGFISQAPHSLDGWRLLAQDRVRGECYSGH